VLGFVQVVSAKAGEHTESRKIAVSAVFGKDIVVLGKLVNWLGAANWASCSRYSNAFGDSRSIDEFGNT
jgi:hypothetical protein